MTIMMIIALIFKILLLIIMTMMIMMMMMMMTTIVVLGKMITIKMIRITQENDRNIMMMMMIGNGRFSRTLDPEICVTPWLDRKTSVIKFESEDFVVAFLFLFIPARERVSDILDIR